MKWKAENTEIRADANKNVFIHVKQKCFKYIIKIGIKGAKL